MSPAETARAKNFVLALLAMAQFVVVLDASIVNVALPSIGSALDFAQDDLSWVVNAYTLVFGGFLLLGGRLADLLGRRRMFVYGMWLFALASLVGGLASSDVMLIAARAVQGLGAALISPAALAILTTTFAEGSERNKALGVWGAVAGSGGAVGVLLGGMLTEWAGWEWVLFVNVPIGIAAALIAPRLLDESRDESSPSFDIAGAVSVTAGLALLVYTLVDANNAGWGSTQTLALGALSVALLVAFVFIERRTRYPLVPVLDLPAAHAARGERDRAAARHGAVRDVLLHLALHAAGDGLRAAQGRARVPAARRTDHRLRGRRVSARRAIRLQAGPDRGDAADRRRPVLVQPRERARRNVRRRRPLPLDARRRGPRVSPSCPSRSRRSPARSPRRRDWPPGLINTSQQVGGALGLAVLATISTGRTDDVFAAGEQSRAVALTEGFQDAFLAGAGIALVGAVLAAVLISSRDSREMAEAARRGDAAPVPA